MLGLGWEQHFKRIVRELIALTYVLDSCFFRGFFPLFFLQFFFFFFFFFLSLSLSLFFPSGFNWRRPRHSCPCLTGSDVGVLFRPQTTWQPSSGLCLDIFKRRVHFVTLSWVEWHSSVSTVYIPDTLWLRAFKNAFKLGTVNSVNSLSHTGSKNDQGT